MVEIDLFSKPSSSSEVVSQVASENRKLEVGMPEASSTAEEIAACEEELQEESEKRRIIRTQILGRIRRQE